MKIGILQTGHAPDELKARHGDYASMFMRLLGGHGFDFQTWNVLDMEFPESGTSAEGWLITGSRHGAYDDLPWIAPLEELIRAAHAGRVPIVGICFGHQIVAQALGGTVEKFSGGWSVGPKIYRFDDGREVAINAWHQDQVTALPPGAEVIAESDFCRYAGLVYDGDAAFTVQPHPEYDSAFLHGLIEHRGRGLVPDALLDAAEATLDRPLDRDYMAGRIAEFFKRPRGRTAE